MVSYSKLLPRNYFFFSISSWQETRISEKNIGFFSWKQYSRLRNCCGWRTYKTYTDMLGFPKQKTLNIIKMECWHIFLEHISTPHIRRKKNPGPANINFSQVNILPQVRVLPSNLCTFLLKISLEDWVEWYTKLVTVEPGVINVQCTIPSCRTVAQRYNRVDEP